MMQEGEQQQCMHVSSAWECFPSIKKETVRPSRQSWYQRRTAFSIFNPAKGLLRANREMTLPLRDESKLLTNRLISCLSISVSAKYRWPFPKERWSEATADSPQRWFREALRLGRANWLCPG